MVSYIPECVSNLTGTLNKKKVAAVGMQNLEPCTSTGVQTSRKSTSLIPKWKTATPKASSVPKSQHTKKSSNPPLVPPPPRIFSTNTFTTTVQVHSTPITTRSAARSAAKTVDSALPSLASANMAMQIYVKQKMKSTKKTVGELSA